MIFFRLYRNNVGNPASICVDVQYPNTAKFQGTSAYGYGYQNSPTPGPTSAGVLTANISAPTPTPYQGYGHGHELSSDDPQYERRMPMRKEKLAPKPPTTIYCETCKVSCPGEQNYQAHCDGHKHRKRVAAVAAAAQQSNVPTPVIKTTIHCEICSLNCSGNDSYQAHLRGKQHAKTIRLYHLRSLPVPEVSQVNGCDQNSLANTSASESVSVVGTLNLPFVRGGALSSFNPSVSRNEENEIAKAQTTVSNDPILYKENQPAENLINQVQPVPPSLPSFQVANASSVENGAICFDQPKTGSVPHFSATVAPRPPQESKTQNFTNMDCIETVSTDGKVQFFRCTLCDCRLLEGVKTSHLVGRRHQQALKRKMEPTSQPQTEPQVEMANQSSVEMTDQLPVEVNNQTPVEFTKKSLVEVNNPSPVESASEPPTISIELETPLVSSEHLHERTVAPFLYFKNFEGKYVKYLPVSSVPGDFPIGSPNVTATNESLICVGGKDVISIKSIDEGNFQSETLPTQSLVSIIEAPISPPCKSGPSLNQLARPRSHQFRPMFIPPHMIDSRRPLCPNLEDRHIIKKHADILPREADIRLIHQTVAKVERLVRESSEEVMFELDTKEYVDLKEETDLIQCSVGYDRVFMALHRVGLLAKNLMLKGDHIVDLVVMCRFKPTLHLLDLFSKKVSEKLEVSFLYLQFNAFVFLKFIFFYL